MTSNSSILVALLGGMTFLPSAAPAQTSAGTAASDPAAGSAESRIEQLQAQVEALQQALTTIKAEMVKATPSWKGAPLSEDKSAGWSFKPRGRIQYDVGNVSSPGDTIETRNLGFNTRARRIRLGAEGTIPGGFGYKTEMDFANAGVGFGDVVLTYAPRDKPFNFTIGNHETWNGLEQISSSRWSSFAERAAFDEAFINTRRIGLSLGLNDKANVLRFNAGLFAAHSIDSSLDNDGWIAAARATYSPQALGGVLHLGANVQHREFQSNNGGTASSSSGAPSTNQVARYRARPFSQLTDVRFVDTGNFAAKGDNIFGLEFAGVFKSLHLAAEGQLTRVNAYRRGDRIGGGLDQFATASFLVPAGRPTFYGGYAELGYFLTGETRGYRNGLWDRTHVLKPFSQGGWGAFQLNGRVDYLDLEDDRLKHGFTNNFLTGTFTPSTSLARGGRQLGLLASLIWIPEDYFRMMLMAGHADITGGPQAGAVEPTSTEPLDQRGFGVDIVAARAQLDF